jgi:hypothetical protein
MPHVDDYRDVQGLDVKPPDVWRYFVRVKPTVLNEFMKKNNLSGMTKRQAEDEFIFQNSFNIRACSIIQFQYRAFLPGRNVVKDNVLCEDDVTSHIKLTRYSYNRLMFCNKG